MGIRISTSTTRSIEVRKPAGRPAKRADGACTHKRGKALSVHPSRQYEVEELLSDLVLMSDEEGWSIVQKTAERTVFTDVAKVYSDDERDARLFMAAPAMFAALAKFEELFAEMHRVIAEADDDDEQPIVEVPVHFLYAAQKALAKARGMQLCLCGRAFHPQD